MHRGAGADSGCGTFAIPDRSVIGFGWSPARYFGTGTGDLGPGTGLDDGRRLAGHRPTRAERVVEDMDVPVASRPAARGARFTGVRTPFVREALPVVVQEQRPVHQTSWSRRLRCSRTHASGSYRREPAANHAAPWRGGSRAAAAAPLEFHSPVACPFKRFL